MDMAVEASAEPQRRCPAPSAIKVLLPVWGYSYARQFLRYSLPTLLAPGNIPAIAAESPTEFVLLTTSDDADFIQEHPTFKKLAAVCKSTVRSIDHLITEGNPSTTITLAYTEAIRAVGSSMVDTCFFLLSSNHVVADGSLANALKRMQGGISAVVVGGVQAVGEEETTSWLLEEAASTGHELALPSRVLMRWTLNHLHPTTLADTVNLPLNHNSRPDRLFWRIDGDTILGRFYLMRVLCVRPEITNFIITGSCDQSFIPEMCPSGEVGSITDSDECLLVELQPRSHDAAFLRPGSIAITDLANSLSRWTAPIHWNNAQQVHIFHAADLPNDALSRWNLEADRFLTRITDHLKRGSQLPGDRSYGSSAFAQLYPAAERKFNDKEWRDALNLPANENQIAPWLVRSARYALMARPPRVLAWHPWWPDFNALTKELAHSFSQPSLRLLLLSNESSVLSLSLTDRGERVHKIRGVQFLRQTPDHFTPFNGTFDLCLLELSEADLINDGAEYVQRIVPLMKNGGQIIVSVENRRLRFKTREFSANVAFQSTRLITSGVLPTEVHFVPLNPVRRLARRGFSYLQRLADGDARWFVTPLVVVGGGFLLILSAVGNLDALRRNRGASERGHKSSIIIRMSVNASELSKPPVNRLHEELFAVSGDKSLLPSMHSTREPQYNRCVELKELIGLTSLGLMTNQVWRDDPRRFAFLLARYKFVAKMLSGCHDVGEVGCGDAFGARVVLQEVRKITVYDFDPVFIGDIRERQSERWSLNAELHDIVTSPLPRRHDALYSLDVLEHIAPDDEDAYLANLCKSLTDSGLLIIGTPSVESQTYASAPSKAGHINCKTGKELKALLKKYFTHVFMFSMNDEVVHTGFAPMAHYLFALCAEPRWQLSGMALRDPEQRPKHTTWPQFEICEGPNAGEFSVRVTYHGNTAQTVEGFDTVADAAGWISDRALNYIDPYRTRM
jgi:SAM-dependent methyltransferase